MKSHKIISDILRNKDNAVSCREILLIHLFRLNAVRAMIRYRHKRNVNKRQWLKRRRY